MESMAIIRHRLDLLIRLIDTTSGNIVSDRAVSFITKDGEFRPHVRDDGVYLLIDYGREDFDFTIKAFGYEDKHISVRYAELDEAQPYIEAHIIPNLYYNASFPCYTLKGVIPGLTAIDAVKLSDRASLIKDFDLRKRLITVFTPHRHSLDRKHYAVVNPDDETYEAINIIKSLSDQVFQCDSTLHKPFSSHFQVCRRVFGSVSERGEYLLRVRNDSSRARWAVRFISGAEEGFVTVDFTKPETLSPLSVFKPFANDS